MVQGMRAYQTEQNIQEWIVKINDCRSSGKTVEAWCKEHGCCVSTFYRWQKIIYEEAMRQHPEFAELPAPREAVRAESRDLLAQVKVGSAELEIYSSASAEIGYFRERTDGFLIRHWLFQNAGGDPLIIRFVDFRPNDLYQ